jgi:hypothetical protein
MRDSAAVRRTGTAGEGSSTGSTCAAEQGLVHAGQHATGVQKCAIVCSSDAVDSRGSGCADVDCWCRACGFGDKGVFSADALLH